MSSLDIMTGIVSSFCCLSMDLIDGMFSLSKGFDFYFISFRT